MLLPIRPRLGAASHPLDQPGPGPRQLGALAGAVTESADCWAPDPEIEALFYGTDQESCTGRRVAERPQK